jgi:predicted transcriptional regulator of viral defense system
MKGLSKKETEIIAELEFDEKYYFSKEDIRPHFDKDSHMRHTIHKLIEKKRIVSLNKNKYFLIPIKAKEGKWGQDPFILADEIFNGKDYFIGGWASANYWRLTDQVPMKIEIFTTKRQGIKKILNTTYIFKRTTENRIKKSVTKKIKGHKFKILNIEDTKEWLKKRT